MDVHEAVEILVSGASVYFSDDPTDFGIEHMREHCPASQSRPHPHWSQIKAAFEIVPERCTEAELNDLVENDFNTYVPILPEGARGFLANIYKSVFEVE